LGSKGGTFKNGEKLSNDPDIRGVEVRSGDYVQLGQDLQLPIIADLKQQQVGDGASPDSVGSGLMSPNANEGK
jgi:hypothetical protein